MIGGVSVNIDDIKKEAILNIIGIKTQQRKSGQAHLVELLKLKTIQKIESKLLEDTKKLQDDTSRTEGTYTADEAENAQKFETILEDVVNNLKLSNDNENADFNKRQQLIKDGFAKDTDIKELENIEKGIYSYELFTGKLDDYKLCNIDKEITALNIFKLFYDLTTMDEDKRKGMQGGGIKELFQITTDDNKKESIIKTKENDIIASRKKLYEDLLKENKTTITKLRQEFQNAGIVEEIKKKSETTVSADLQLSNTPYSRKYVNPSSLDETILGSNETDAANAQAKREADVLKTMNDLKKAELNIKLQGEYDSLKEFFNNNLFNNKSLLYHKAFMLKESPDNSLKLEITDLAKQFFNTRYESNKPGEKEKINKIYEYIKIINNDLDNVKDYFTLVKKSTDLDNLQTVPHVGKVILNNPDNFISTLQNIKNEYEFFKTKDLFKNTKNTQYKDLRTEGGNPVKYKSTGQVVHIMFQNKKYKRVIYVKEKRNTKYCKMNNEYILLSKLKVIE